MKVLAYKLVSGFLLSLVFTLVAYILVVDKVLQGNVLLVSVMTLALLQTITQLVLFLHLGDEPKPQWKLMTFLFMITVLVIIVAGSLWIMYHLDYNMMAVHD